MYLSNGVDVKADKYAGFLLRTKLEGVDEGGVATGFSCLNSVILG